MSNKLKIKVTSGFYKGHMGTIEGRIPGGSFFKVMLDDGKLTAIHELEFKRISNDKLLHNEIVKKPIRSVR